MNNTNVDVKKVILIGMTAITVLSTTVAYGYSANLVEPSQTPVIGHRVDNGAPVRMGDFLVSEFESNTEIKLLDGTLLTIEPKSELVINDYIYNPEEKISDRVGCWIRDFFRDLAAKVQKSKFKGGEIAIMTLGIRG